MRYCLCGRAIPPPKRKGGREQEYCCNTCCQRACRARKKVDRDIKAILEGDTRHIFRLSDEKVTRTTWGRRQAREQQSLAQLVQALEDADAEIEALEQLIKHRDNIIADKEAEIARLATLLNADSKKRKSR